MKIAKLMIIAATLASAAHANALCSQMAALGRGASKDVVAAAYKNVINGNAVSTQQPKPVAPAANANR